MNFKFLRTDLKDMLRRHFLTWLIYLSLKSAQKLTSRWCLQNSLPSGSFWKLHIPILHEKSEKMIYDIAQYSNFHLKSSSSLVCGLLRVFEDAGVFNSSYFCYMMLAGIMCFLNQCRSIFPWSDFTPQT